jgi:hypothetical protein
LPIKEPSLDPPENPTETAGNRISDVLSFDRRQPRSTGTAGPSLPRRKSVLATRNRTFDHRSTTQSRTPAPAPPALTHRFSPLPSISHCLTLSRSLISVSLRLSLLCVLFLSLEPTLSPNLTLCISPSR